jgi:hypothetical protein
MHDPGSEPHTDGGEKLTSLFEAFSSQRRRYILYYLQRENQTGVDAVAEQVAAWERGQPIEELPEEHVHRVRVELVHTHIGILRDAALIEYDHRTKEMVFRDPPRILEAFLHLCAEFEEPPSP